MHKFRKLSVWKKSMDFVNQVYVITRDFPKFEQFCLTSQLRRSSLSIPLNIAEGAGSGSDREFKRFLRISLRSIYETITSLEIAQNQKFINNKHFNKLTKEADEIAAMTSGLIKRLTTED